MHEIRFLSAELAETIHAVFSDYGTLTLTPFNVKIAGEVTIFHSAPFMDEATYGNFLLAVNDFNLTGWSFIEIPFEVGSKYIHFKQLPKNFSHFNNVMVARMLAYAGGIFFNESMLVIGTSVSDVELVIIKINDKLGLTFENTNSIITKSEADKLLKNHLEFLSSTDG